ncbi:MAG TPA: error-prone DNA polymerase [Candidatus Acidoferrales bacterium]|nr:error-prone DNA polymerase [Candidatus Acidoferrales bacterium]
MYTELHARSAFSFLEGASLPEELAGACAELGIPGMALLDRDGVYGAPRFFLAANKSKICAHVGAEITSEAGWRYPLLVTSQEGYQNLCRLITRMKLRARKGEGHVQIAELADRTAGLICMTGGEEGPLAHALGNGGIKNGIRCMQQLCELFGRTNVYVELQRHLSREEEARNQAAVEIARRLHLPLLATNGVCHAVPQRRQILDVFTCIRNHKNLGSAGRLLSLNSERHLKAPAKMKRLFSDLPEAIANTQELSSRLQFTLNDLGYKFPVYPVPDGATQIHFLRKLSRDGLISRYGNVNERARLQIEHELTVIEKLDLAGYFLIVWDIVRFCRDRGILVQGRGSAANSAVCYALGITAVDPVGMDLLFERFLSEERGEWPDIDLDLPSGEQRERAIQYVYQRYGQLGAAMTANVITYRGRSAAREIGKVLSFDVETISRLTKLVSAWEYKAANDTLANQFHDAGFDLKHPQIRKFFDLCLEVQDLPRHLGQHSGGLVICQGQLDSVVPLEPATMPGRVVVQWDKDDCASMGIVKVDLLGLGMMAVLEESLQIIHKQYGEEIDLGKLPANDPVVYSTLQKADTVGMFQIESRAQMSCLPRLVPKCFYDIVVQVAIIRPGPIVGQMVNPYLKRRQGRETVDYLHPSLEPVLARTLGVPLFQEQLLRMAMIAAGFSGGEAEELRRAFGFKRSEVRMKDIEQKLRLGMTRNHIASEIQEKIILAITSFALYGFPESHAASFALIAYASAYLKCHFLPAFTAAILNNQPMGFYQPATLVKDAQRHGLKVRPVNVTCSDWLCTLEENGEDFAMRLGMRCVTGLRREVAETIVRERAIFPFTSIHDLKLRVPFIHKSELTMLAEIGALNFISGKNSIHRRDALWQVERVARRAGPLLEKIELPAMSEGEFHAEERLYGDEPSGFKTSPLKPMTSEEKLRADFNGTGMTVGPHPMSYHRKKLKRQGVRCASELSSLPNGIPVRIAGAVIARQRPGTAKGFVFLSMEDETGIANAIISPQTYDTYHLIVVHQQFLLIEGQLQNQENVISVKAEVIRPLPIVRVESSSHDFH